MVDKNEIEASWAPTDPRDRLNDITATPAQKGGSLFRIVAAFHPVLNVPVLMYDSFKKLGWKLAIVLWVGLVAALVALAFFIQT